MTKAPEFTQEQIIWMQEWLSLLERDFQTGRRELARELYRMKKPLVEQEKLDRRSLLMKAVLPRFDS